VPSLNVTRYSEPHVRHAVILGIILPKSGSDVARQIVPRAAVHDARAFDGGIVATIIGAVWVGLVEAQAPPADVPVHVEKPPSIGRVRPDIGRDHCAAYAAALL